MKLIRVTFLAFALLALLGPSLLVSAAEDKGCGCVCCILKETAAGTSPGGFGVSVGTVRVCVQDTASDTKTTKAESEDACIKDCGQKKDSSGVQNYGVRSCNKGDCWCKSGKDFQFIKQTGDLASCQQLCTDNKLEFGNWGSPPSATSSAVKCPPGGMWTQEECTAVKDPVNPKVSIGDWDPPPGYTKGPYCYVKQPPIKLNVAIGGLTAATLADYLAAAFKLGIGMGAVLAVIMIMIGGFRYIMAAGGSGISGAKDMIKNAVIGLLLTVLAFTLLQTVNPDITSLKLPRVQIVKPCSVAVSCASRKDEPSCSNNPSDSGMRCVWNNAQSICYDNSSMESGAVGKNGGECIRSGDDGHICTDGSKCITIDSNTYKCSKGGSCQSCVTDADCSSASGAPGKCDASSHQCMIPDPNGQQGTYLKCSGGGASCKLDTECDSGFCNTTTHTCGASNQGVNCMQGGQGQPDQDSCATGSGYQCVPFTKNGAPVGSTNSIWKAACCLNGNVSGCLGCDKTSVTNFDCPDTMKCDPATSKCVTK